VLSDFHNNTLEISKLAVSQGKSTILSDLSLTVTSGQIVCLMGPNGAGKTTTFQAIMGLKRPDSGCIRLNDRDITRIPIHRIAQLGMVFLPQEPSIFHQLSVEDNIRAILRVYCADRAEENYNIKILLTTLRIRHLRDALPHTLSGGERRRVEIARLLATRPIIMVLDEPFAGVDPLAIHELQIILRQLKDQDLGILISDHNVREALQICDQVYIISNGALIAQGDPMTVVEQSQAREQYFGAAFRL
jgi:lipopolysaccharide export system ATP-binding protein